MMFNIGDIIFDNEDRTYSIDSLIGPGGFGLVYKVIRTEDNEEFAVKTFLPSQSGSVEVLLNEGGMATRIQHENVIEYLYFHDGTEHKTLPPYLLMEYAPDGDLTQVINNQNSLNRIPTNESLVVIYKQLISGMKAINAKIVHRDIKPDNILIKSGALKISDFGLAKLAEESTCNGSVETRISQSHL